ncbi:MAG TPA: YfhO family protein, partial [Lachnoclostridium phocaeense]|nr:YfhO family protein [Lachnoclostridium phocaeense]
EISDAQAWYGSADDAGSGQAEYVDAGLELTADGDGLTGSFTTENGGWLITSIPYDQHFTVYIDGKEVPASQVNGGFLGAETEAGSHQVEIRYDAPGKASGLAVSLAAALFLGADALRKKYGVSRK